MSEIGQTLRKIQGNQINENSVYLVNDIQNNEFKDIPTSWLLKKEEEDEITKPGSWRHIVAVEMST